MLTDLLHSFSVGHMSIKEMLCSKTAQPFSQAVSNVFWNQRQDLLIQFINSFLSPMHCFSVLPILRKKPLLWPSFPSSFVIFPQKQFSLNPCIARINQSRTQPTPQQFVPNLFFPDLGPLLGATNASRHEELHLWSSA